MKKNLFLTLMLVLLALPLTSCGNDEPVATKEDPFADLVTFNDAIDDCVFTATVRFSEISGDNVFARISHVEFLSTSPYLKDPSGYNGPDERDLVQFRRGDLPNQAYSCQEVTEIHFKIKAWKSGNFFEGLDSADHLYYRLVIEPA